MPPSQLSELINAQIERLRPKLLDLTLRNPLLSTKFTDRSQAYIRIVDELPEVLAEQLLDSAMCFIPLPSLEDNPKDENTREFQNAWAQAQLEESYLSRLDNIDPDADDSLEKIALIEREMRDQIRHDLGLPPRQTRSNLSLEQHALNNHISPSYELPKPQGSSSNKQHYDSNMQTLFLPDAMERRLNSIYSKCRTWTQETGINVLQAAFGFLEWQDSPDSKIAYAPLLLLPVALEKKKTEEGYEFWLSATGEQLEFNTVLAEKFRLDFGIQLPELEEEEDVESYLAKIADISPKNFRWKVRRQVAVGVFPSTRLAMYKDLDTNGWDFTTHENIVKLLGGATASAASPFGDEYNVDDPNHESKVPLLVTQADSSQFSVLIDIANGKSLAVEGPPGTGKSQTIVNTIASAIADNKKVLFVAEKMAALEVVRSRLEANGLAEFLLPLQASRGSKEEIIASIRQRREMQPTKDPRELDEAIEKFRQTRQELAEYINVISSYFGKTNLKIYDVLWKSIKSQGFLESLSQSFLEVELLDVSAITPEIFRELTMKCQRLEQLWHDASQCSKHWKDIGIPDIDPFSAEEILKFSEETAELCDSLYEYRLSLEAYGLSASLAAVKLQRLHCALESVAEVGKTAAIQIARRLSSKEKIETIQYFLDEAKQLRRLKDKLSQVFVDPLSIETEVKLSQLSSIMQNLSLITLDTSERKALLEFKKYEIDDLRKVIAFIERLTHEGFPVTNYPLAVLIQ